MSRRVFRSIPSGLLAVALMLNSIACAARGDHDRLQLIDGVPSLDVPVARVVPKVDASIDDQAWTTAARIDGLRSSFGTSSTLGGPLPTKVLLLWDAECLYVRFVCDDADVYVPFQGNDRDRDYYKGDACEVFLDVIGDGKQVFEIQVTPANQVFDQTLLVTADRVVCDARGRYVKEILDRDLWKNISYDIAGLRTAAGKSADGKQWIVDIALPAAAVLRRAGKKQFEPMTLRANLLRYDWVEPSADAPKRDRLLNPMNWSVVEFGRPHQSPAAMGELRLVNETK